MEILLEKLGAVEVHIMIADDRETGIGFSVDGRIEPHDEVREDVGPFTAFVGQVAGEDGEYCLSVVALGGDVFGET